MSTTHHTVERAWDAPFERIKIAYAFTPGTPDLGPSFNDAGEMGEDDLVEPLLCSARINGVWEDQSERVLQAMASVLRDDLVMEAREDRDEWQSYARAATREEEYV